MLGAASLELAAPAVVLVDDDPADLSLLRRAIGDVDAPILAAHNADDALDIVRSRLVAVLITDVRMPRTDGFELASTLHGTGVRALPPVIFVTGAPLQRERTEVWRHGAVDLLFKPVDPVEIRSKVRVFVDMARELSLRDAPSDEDAALELFLARREIEEFVSTLGHEVQEPLRNAAYLLERALGPKAPRRPSASELRGVERAVRRSGACVAALLDFVRMGELDEPLGPVDLGEAASLALAGLAGRIEKEGARVRVGPLGVARGSLPRLARVIEELVSNALDFCGPEGADVTIGGRSAAGSVELVVCDRGIGIPPERRGQIFELFERLGPERSSGSGAGAGAGLAVVRKIVRLHGGRVWVESDPERGETRFHVLLPPAPRRRVH